jgi:hypothetical protein
MRNRKKGAVMDERQMLRIVEAYYLKPDTQYEGIKISRVADWKTVFVEQIGESGRAVMMNQYKVDGSTCWAGYSSRSQTIYISLTA